MLAGIRLARVAKRYRRGTYVLRDVEQALTPGDLVHVSGGNGSGKSTLLRIIAGVSAPSRGTVEGRPRSVGYVPERFPPTVPFTPATYLRHLAAIRGCPTNVGGFALLEQLGAGRFADTPMKELSKGTTQKVMIAQALMGAPSLLVLDEAWTGLDREAQTTLGAEVQRRAAAGTVVVLTDHAARPVAPTPTHVWHIAEGDVIPVEVAIFLAQRTKGVIVVLSGRSGAAGLPGATVNSVADGETTLEVPQDRVDELLAEALQRGWSVREVHR